MAQKRHRSKEKKPKIIIYFQTAAIFLTVFLAGMSMCKVILEIGKLDIVQENSYIKIKDLPKKYVTQKECEEINQRRKVLVTRINYLEKKNKELSAQIQGEIGKLKSKKISAAEKMAQCNLCRESHPTDSSLYCRNLCSAAAKASVEVEVLEKTIKNLDDRYNAIEVQISSLQNKL